MLLEKYLQKRIQQAESILAAEELAGNVPKAMAQKAAIAELRGIVAFLASSINSEAVKTPTPPERKNGGCV